MPPALPLPPPRPPGSLVWPLPSIDPFWRRNVGSGRPRSAAPDFTRHHAGQDIQAITGRTVVAMQAGRVRRMGWTKTTDAVVVDDGVTGTLHGGLDPESVTAASHVEAGEPIGTVGRGYGQWLHVEVRRGGAPLEQKWWWGSPPPAALYDPGPYLEAATMPAVEPELPEPELPELPERPTPAAPYIPPPPPGPLTPAPAGPTTPAPSAGATGGPGLAVVVLVGLVLAGGDS